MKINKVGVVGIGTMGAGIVQVSAQSGFSVTVFDMDQKVIEKGLANIDFWLRKSVDRGRITAEKKERITSRIKGTGNISDFNDCDLVIEAVFDNMEIKRKVFSELDNICPAHTILASNSSTLSIIDIASATKRMDKVLGMHFFNPVTCNEASGAG